MIILRTAVMLSTLGAAFAQAPGMFPWWDSPIARNLGLSDQQQRQIRSTVEEARGALSRIRAEVHEADLELAAVMNEDTVDPLRADAAVERVVAARSELTRSVTQMGLRLRLLLTPEQWQELQRRQRGSRMFSPPGRPPGRGGGPPRGRPRIDPP